METLSFNRTNLLIIRDHLRELDRITDIVNEILYILDNVGSELDKYAFRSCSGRVGLC